MYLCALEPRIQAVVVVEGHTENVAGANYESPGAYADAEQNIVGSLKLGLDRGDLLSSFCAQAAADLLHARGCWLYLLAAL